VFKEMDYKKLRIFDSEYWKGNIKPLYMVQRILRMEIVCGCDAPGRLPETHEIHK
jgi:hypothetical protein